ncbi:MAG: ComF family protein [Chloroflexi bacterium]|nr:ComF family protein [Chloroflexota bacterium]
MQLDFEEIHFNRKPADFFWKAVDYIFPPFCCHCGRLGYEICPDCFESIEMIDQSLFCEKCGKSKHKDKVCNTEGIFFDRIHSWGYYTGPLKSIVQKLKYNRGLGLVRYLIPDLCDCISLWFDDLDLIIPLPLGRKRELSRGYNQTALFAKPIARELQMKYLPGAVERTRETISQVGLSAAERKANIFEAFHSDQTLVTGLKILLMDDITTTGATINECAKSLKLAGAARVYCFTLAKAKNLI